MVCPISQALPQGQSTGVNVSLLVGTGDTGTREV